MPATATPASRPALAALVLLFFVLILGARSVVSGPSDEFLRERLVQIGVERGFCSPQFLEPFWGDRVQDAGAVCRCESSGRPGVVSLDGRYYGLFQVDAVVHGIPVVVLFNPIYNAAFSAGLQERDGWEPWPVCGQLAGT